MKKTLSSVVSIALISSMFATAVFAADATPTAGTATTTAATTGTTELTVEQKYEALKALGIFEGDTTGANLDGLTTRAQVAKILAKTFQLKEDATGASVYKDLDGAGWAAGFIGAVTKAGLMDGVWDGTFDPSSNVTMEQLATILVRGLKIAHPADATVDGKVADWAKEYVAAAVKAGLVSAKTDYTAAAKRSDLVTSGYTTYQKVLESIKPPAAKEVDLKSAVAFNSKVVEVKLNTAVDAVDASAFTIKDAAGAAVAVANVALASYDSAKKTVIVTLGADTTAGTLYTITSGSKTANFGGVAVDATKPTVSSVTGSDFNKVTIVFSEAIQADGAAISVKEAYGSNTALKVNSIKQTAKNTIVLTTDIQTKTTLYALDIAGVKDFAGNVMAQDTAQTFVSNVVDTELKIVGAASNNPDEVIVKFNSNVDASTIAAADFTVTDAYGTSTVTVKEARVATTADLDETLSNTGVVSGNEGLYVVLTTTGQKDTTLYNVKAVAGLKSTYGKGLSGTAGDVTTSFVGTGVPTSGFAYDTVSTGSNTQVRVKFNRKVDKATAETIANYAIAESYGTNKLTVSAAALQADEKTVYLTVSSMSNSLYTLTTTNVKDKWNNGIKTDSSANVTTFVGAAVQDKITSATVARVDNNHVDVTFNKNINAAATDVGRYSIDGGIGYPQEAVLQTASNVVRLTIPTTTQGQVYTLTVKGLVNSDNVAMDSAGITATFIGSGNEAGLPKINSVLTTDDHTIKVFFNRSVTDATVAGFIWGNDSTDAANYKKVLSGQLKVTQPSGADVLLAGKAAVQDPDNANVLIVRSATADFSATNGQYTLVATGTTQRIHSDTLSRKFAGNSTAAAGPKITGAISNNNSNVTVYFDSPVANVAAGQFLITPNADGTGTPIAVNSVFQVNARTYQLGLSGTMATQTYYVFVQENTATPGVATGNGVVNGSITDLTGTYGLQSTSNNAAGDYSSTKFAGTAAAPANYTNIGVIAQNKHQVDVYFTERMNASLVTDVNNYHIYTTSAATTATGKQPVFATYDTGTNKVTLYFNGDLTENGSANKYYLGISSAIKNVTGSNQVKADVTIAGLGITGTGVISQFVNSTADAALPKISSVSANVYNDILTVTFDRPVGFGAAPAFVTGGAVADNAFTTGTFSNTALANLASYFTVTGAVYNVGGVTGNVSIDHVVRSANNQVKIYLDRPIVNGGGGTVTLISGTTPTQLVFTASGDVAKTGSDAPKANFGVGTASAH